MSLTPEERQRIYEEERARIEARAQAEADVKAEKEAAQAPSLSKPGNALITLVLTVLLGFAVIWFYNSISNKQSAPLSTVSTSSTLEASFNATETPDNVVASTLYQEYDSNQIAADKKYKGRKLSISGTVQYISYDILGEPFIVLSDTDLSTGVQCMFPRSDANLLASLHKGNEVIVVGHCDGHVLLNVLIRECSLAPNMPPVIAVPDDTVASSITTKHSDDSLDHPPLNNFDDFVAQMGSTPFKEAWLESFSKSQLTELRNEPYARHGYRFKDASLRAFFEAQPWYHPTTSDQSRAEAKFTQTERDNIHTVQECERWLKHPNN